jgi:phosphomannomutase
MVEVYVRIPESLMMGVSGARGLIGEGMNTEIAARLAAAFASLLNGGMVVMGRDTRPSGLFLSRAVDATLRFAGVTVIDLGIVATPTVEIMVQEFDADGGVIITASHNGPEWNALKFLGRGGEFLEEADMKRIGDLAAGDDNLFRADTDYGALREEDSSDAMHIKKILELPLIDRERISAAGFKAAVDCVNGAGSRIIPALLRTLGVEVVEIFTETDAPFPHNPEPRPENLTELSRAVRESGADIGFACDPDADRLVLVDGRGTVQSEELTLAVAGDFVLGREKGAVVANVSTSRLLEWLGEKHGVPVGRTKVGEANVIAGMKAMNAVIGGEGNGGVIYPALHYGRDAMIGIALVLQALAEEGVTLAEKTANMPSYHIIKEKIRFRGSLIDLRPRFVKEFAGRLDETDGLKMDMEGGWIHMRLSNTEPVVRLIAEAGSQDEARSLVDRAGSMISTVADGEA